MSPDDILCCALRSAVTVHVMRRYEIPVRKATFVRIKPLPTPLFRRTSSTVLCLFCDTLLASDALPHHECFFLVILLLSHHTVSASAFSKYPTARLNLATYPSACATSRCLQ